MPFFIKFKLLTSLSRLLTSLTGVLALIRVL